MRRLRFRLKHWLYYESWRFSSRFIHVGARRVQQIGLKLKKLIPSSPKISSGFSVRRINYKKSRERISRLPSDRQVKWRRVISLERREDAGRWRLVERRHSVQEPSNVPLDVNKNESAMTHRSVTMYNRKYTGDLKRVRRLGAVR